MVGTIVEPQRMLLLCIYDTMSRPQVQSPSIGMTLQH